MRCNVSLPESEEAAIVGPCLDDAWPDEVQSRPTTKDDLGITCAEFNALAHGNGVSGMNVGAGINPLAVIECAESSDHLAFSWQGGEGISSLCVFTFFLHQHHSEHGAYKNECGSRRP